MAILSDEEVNAARRIRVGEALQCMNLLEEVRRILGHDHPEATVVYQLGVRLLANARVPEEEPRAERGSAEGHRFMPWVMNHTKCAACGLGSNAHDLEATLVASLELIRANGGA